VDIAPARPAKRRKVAKQKSPIPARQEYVQAFEFEVLLNGLESPESARLRQELFESCWSDTEERIQVCENTLKRGELG
jgi:hypothetical protein